MTKRSRADGPTDSPHAMVHLLGLFEQVLRTGILWEMLRAEMGCW
jgi:hypothetical protein